MRLVVGVFVVFHALIALAENSASPVDKHSVEADLRQLQKEFSERLYNRVLPGLDALEQGNLPDAIAEQVEGLWNDVFGAHQSLFKRRAGDILAALDKAQPVDEQQFELVGESQGIEQLSGNNPLSVERLGKMLLWNPLMAAEQASMSLLARHVKPTELGKRAILQVVAQPPWEAIDASLEHPKLVRRMGPEIFVVELTREKDRFYMPTRTRWLRRKSSANAIPAGPARQHVAH